MVTKVHTKKSTCCRVHILCMGYGHACHQVDKWHFHLCIQKDRKNFLISTLTPMYLSTNNKFDGSLPFASYKFWTDEANRPSIPLAVLVTAVSTTRLSWCLSSISSYDSPPVILGDNAASSLLTRIWRSTSIATASAVQNCIHHPCQQLYVCNGMNFFITRANLGYPMMPAGI